MNPLAISLILFSVPLIIIWFFHLLTKNALLKNDGKVLYLHSSFEHVGPLGWFHWFLEKIVFMRVDAYKNHPRGNFLWVRSVAFTTFSFGIIYLLSVFIVGFKEVAIICNSKGFENVFKVIGIYLGLIGTLYWQEKVKFKDKWNYLAGLYNEILKCWGSEAKHALMSNALAIDSIVTMMWNHRSFSGIVITELRASLNDVENSDIKLKYLEKMNANRLTESEALEILEAYQKILIERFPSSRPETH